MNQRQHLLAKEAIKKPGTNRWARNVIHSDALAPNLNDYSICGPQEKKLMQREIKKISLLGDKESLDELECKLEPIAKDLPENSLSGGRHRPVRIQSIDVLEGLVIAIGGGAGIAAIIKAIGEAIASVIQAHPETSLKIETPERVYELRGCSSREVHEIVQKSIESTSETRGDESSGRVQALDAIEGMTVDHLYNPISGVYQVPVVQPIAQSEDRVPSSKMPKPRQPRFVQSLILE